jgi:hypothetical protein
MGCVYVPNWFSGITKVFLILLITCILTFFTSIFTIRDYVRDDWGTYRCDPFIMMFAWVFGYDTVKNFHVCIGKDVKRSSKKTLNPYNDILKTAGTTMQGMAKSITSATLSQITANENMGNTFSILGEIMQNVSVSIDFLMHKVKAIFDKILAVYVSLLYAAWSLLKGFEAMIRDKNVQNILNIFTKL